METAVLLTEIDEANQIYQLTLNLPEQLNAVNTTMIAALRNHLQTLEKKEVRGLIINSNTPKAFCAGIDVKKLKLMTNEAAADLFEELADTLVLLAETNYVTVAAVSGYAFGAGADIALACDLRVADNTVSFRFPGPQFGLVLGTERLVNEIGASAARKLVLTNERIFVEEAERLGIVHEIASGDVVEAALQTVNKATAVPGHPLKTLKAICNQVELNQTAGKLAKDSVLVGDFKERFVGYLSGMKKK